MDVKIYTQNQSIFTSSHSFLFKYFEYILLFLVAATGLLCSAFALSNNAGLPGNDHYRQIVGYEAKKSDFDKFEASKKSISCRPMSWKWAMAEE